MLSKGHKAANPFKDFALGLLSTEAVKVLCQIVMHKLLGMIFSYETIVV
jgi:hypothetical protein